jgi:hypothetical protein
MTRHKRLLPVRPHAFIVDEMNPFLACGRTRVKLCSLDELSSALAQPADADVNGSVSSTAVSSSIGAEARQRASRAVRSLCA